MRLLTQNIRLRCSEFIQWLSCRSGFAEKIFLKIIVV